jgi:hypothetical protein
VKKGDVVVIANGVRIESMQGYLQARQIRKDSLELTILRGNRVLEFTVSLLAAQTDGLAPQPIAKHAPRDVT